MDDKLSAALYARVSSQRQADELTIQSQVAALRQRIAEDGVKVEEERCFLDEGYSGSTLIRPSLERLRDVAYAGAIDRLYVYSPDRLARKYAYQVLLLEEFKKHDVQVVFLNQDPQNQTPEGDLLLQVQGMIAEYERAQIMERTRRGRRYAARQGKVSVLSHAPYGYRYVPKHEGDGEARYDVVLEEARVVKAIFSCVAVEGLSLATVARHLTEQGVPTRTGKPFWDRSTVWGILSNRTYTGTAFYGKTRLCPRKPAIRPWRGQGDTPRRDKVPRPTSPEEREPISVPALISQELFQAVAEQLDQNRQRQRERQEGGKYLLSGLVVCCRCGSAYCGRRFPYRKQQKVYIYYCCLGTDRYRFGGEAICHNKSARAERLEEAVWSDVCSVLKDPGRLREEFKRRVDQQPADEGDGTQRIQQIARLKRRISRLIDAYENGWLDKEDFEPRIFRAKERLAHEQEAYVQHQRDLATEEQLRLFVGEFETFAKQMTEGLEQADFQTRRNILRLLIKRIEMHQEEIRIVYKVHCPPFVPGPARGLLQDCVKRQSVALSAKGGVSGQLK